MRVSSDITKAVALKYTDNPESKDKTSSSGDGSLEERMLIDAIKKGIPVYKDPELMEKVANLNSIFNLQNEIFPIVKDVSEFLNKIDRKVQKGN